MELIGEKENRYVIHLYKSLRSLSKTVPVYEIQVQVEGQAKHQLLVDEVLTKTSRICRLYKGLQDNILFIRKSVYDRMSCNWIHIEFRLDRLEKLLQYDQVEIQVDRRDCSIKLKTIQSGSVSYKRNERIVKVERTLSRHQENDLFNCIDVRFMKGLEFEHVHQEALAA